MFVMVGPLLAGCEDGYRSRESTHTTRPSAGASDTANTPSAPASYFQSERVLYRASGSDTVALLALDSAAAPAGVPVLPATWRPIPEAEFGVQGDSLRHIAPSPDGRRVAWEVFSTHGLVGVVPAIGGVPTPLDFYWDSGSDSLVWSPDSRYLAAYYTSPSGFAELPIYDTERGIRLATPWSEECSSRTQCAVVSAEWTGPATISVGTGGGEGGRMPARDFSADAGDMPGWTPPGAR